MLPSSTAPEIVKTVATWLHRGFDATTNWVTQLSWWKFFLFAALALIAGSIVQEELFSSGGEEEVVVSAKKRPGKKGTGDSNIIIDDTGIHFNSRSGKSRSATASAATNVDASRPDASPVTEDIDTAQEEHGTTAPTVPAVPTVPAIPDVPAIPAVPAATQMPEIPTLPSTFKAPTAPAAPMAPIAPMAPVAPTAPKAPSSPVTTSGSGEEVHIDLPPQIGEELSNAIEEAVDDAAEQKVTRYHRQASTWFKSFISLLVLALFAMKALVGGKKRAEAQTMTANAAMERESMQRQLSEAKMQMMQAQVEPHFLFNTLASVEHLIETNPPRASAMQRSLIQYLRAVLPQMRDNTLITNLGREADMVQAYLNLLKMRMEERLNVDLQIPDGLRSAAFPPMMLQSLVENAIKHGLECKPEGGILHILAEVAHNKLRVIVADDGVGFGVVPSDGTGLGLPTIRERLKLLHGEQGQLLITPNHPCGVRSVIEVPYQLAK